MHLVGIAVADRGDEIGLGGSHEAEGAGPQERNICKGPKFHMSLCLYLITWLINVDI